MQQFFNIITIYKNIKYSFELVLQKATSATWQSVILKVHAMCYVDLVWGNMANASCYLYVRRGEILALFCALVWYYRCIQHIKLLSVAELTVTMILMTKSMKTAQGRSESDRGKESSARENLLLQKLPLSMKDSSLIETVCPVAQLGFMCF